MQRTVISVTIFVLVMFIFDTSMNQSAIAHEIVAQLVRGGRNVDNFANNLVAFLRR